MVAVIKKRAGKKDLEKISKEIKPQKPFKASEYCGKIKVKADAVELQRRLRDEWK